MAAEGDDRLMQEEFRAIRLDELDECLDLWGNVFERVGRNYFLPYLHGDPWFKLDYTRVCAVDGKLVSAVQICERKVSFGTADIVMGGIGNVATLPEYRGKGYSSRLLKDCVWVMRSHGIDFSVLFTGIQPFYERVGWRSVRVPFLSGRLKPEIRASSSRKYSVRSRRDDDLEHLGTVYEAFNATRPLTTRRSSQYWDGYVRSHLGSPQNMLVAEHAGAIVGYVYVPSDKETFRVQEIGCLPGHERCIYSLVSHAASPVRRGGAESAWFNVPHEPVVLSALKRVTEKLEVNESQSGMYRLVDTHLLGARMLPELNRRAAQFVLPRIELSLDTELGCLEFTFDDQRVILGARDPIRVKLSQAEFFSLLFGFKPINEMELPIPFEAFQVISALFPRQRPVFWGFDHF
jgi:predicted acetyltransferase